jgi:acyl-coenzyme A thioesterase PaaI-like protein
MTTNHSPNRLERQLNRLSDVPAFARTFFRGVVMHRAVPFTGTAGLDFLEMTPARVEIGLKNEKKVQNHIGGIHASAMNLLAETATGMVVGMNVRDDCIPLCKSMKVDFTRLATGSLRARARLTDAQRAEIVREPRGQVTVAVVVTDEAGANPVECEFVWAWKPKAPKATKN